MANFNNKVLESWWAILRHLNAEVRLELASRLINSLKPQGPVEEERSGWKELYGAWSDENESAEELISIIRDSRFINRQIEPFD